MPSRCLFLDTETRITLSTLPTVSRLVTEAADFDWHDEVAPTIEKHRMMIGWTCYLDNAHGPNRTTKEWRFWDSPLKLCKYIENLSKRKTTLYLFAHNVFFDLQVSDFYYNFTRWGWVLDFFYDKGLTYLLSIHKDTQKIKAISTTNYYKSSLEKVGIMLGYPKSKVDFKTATAEELKLYCRRDVEIMIKAMEHYWSFVKRHKLGGFAMTLSSQSLRAFRHRFMHNKIYIHKEPDIQELELSGYYGGRTECGFFGPVPDGPFVSLDVNSMYPYIMLSKPVPTRLIDYLEKPNLDILESSLKVFCCVASVRLSTDKPAYAIKHHGKTCFPVGVFDATLCTAGLIYAMKHGHIQHIDKLAVYDKAVLFRKYVQHFNRIKENYSKQGDTVMRRLAKEFGNHLYGKFAQMEDIVEEEEDITFNGYFREEIFDMVTKQTEVITKLMNKRFITFDRKPGRSSLIPIAAHITEYARFYLFSIMEQIGLDKVLYCDTDSVKIRTADIGPVNKQLDEHKLGALKIEDRFEVFNIWGAKYYDMNNISKIKGIPKRAEKIGDYTYRYTQFMRQPTHLREQITRFLIARPVTKVVQPFYDKGEILPSGRIIPLHLEPSETLL